MVCNYTDDGFFLVHRGDYIQAINGAPACRLKRLGLVLPQQRRRLLEAERGAGEARVVVPRRGARELVARRGPVPAEVEEEVGEVEQRVVGVDVRVLRLRRRGGGSRTVLPGGSRRRGEVGRGSGGRGARQCREPAMARPSRGPSPRRASARARHPDPAAVRSGGRGGAEHQRRRVCRKRRGRAALRGATAAGGGLGQRTRGAGRGEEVLGQPLTVGRWIDGHDFFDDVARCDALF